MNGLRQVVFGILAALLSTAIILGSLTMALTEGSRQIALAPTPTTVPLLFPSPSPAVVMPGPGASPTPSPSTTPGCPIPSGWLVVLTQPGDTLESLAQAYGTTVEDLAQNNCITPEIHLRPGFRFSVPGLPQLATPTETVFPTDTPEPSETSEPTSKPIPCGHPSGWVTYVVKKGDTLYGLSRIFRITLNQLRSANCIFGTDHIEIGQLLWVPFLPPTQTPTIPTNTPTPTPIKVEITPIDDTPVPITPMPVTPIPETPTEVPTDFAIPTEAIPTSPVDTPPATTEPPVP